MKLWAPVQSFRVSFLGIKKELRNVLLASQFIYEISICAISMNTTKALIICCHDTRLGQ